MWWLEMMGRKERKELKLIEWFEFDLQENFEFDEMEKCENEGFGKRGIDQGGRGRLCETDKTNENQWINWE